MNKLLKISIFSILLVAVVGCGESSSTSGGTGSSLYVDTQKSELNADKNEMKIDFSVNSNYPNDVEVNLSKLSLNITPSTCKVKGKPLFNPSHVTLNGTESRDIHTVVQFYNACSPTSYTLSGTTLLSQNDKSNSIAFNTAEQVVTPVLGVTVENSSEDNSSDPIVVGDVKLPIVVIPNSLKNIILTTNSKTIEMPIKVFKDIAPYGSGTVKVELPKKVLSGSDVGLFEAYEVPVNSQGIATFSYTGPSNLKSLMEKGDLSSVFKFYHTENAKIKQELKIVYDLSDDAYVPMDYSLNIKAPDNDFSMGIPDLQKTFSVILKDSDGNIINDDEINITKIDVQTENALIAKLIDTRTGEGVNELTLKNENNSAFILKSKELSGIVPLRITVDFKDINNEEKRLSTIVNVRVMSGPPSAISISYVSTGHDATRAKYEEKFAISVTDEYGNKVNSRPFISVGAIVGYAVDGQEASYVETNNTKRLFYSKFNIENGSANGSIDMLDDAPDTTNFEDNTPARSDVFQWVNTEGANSDKLVVFGKGKNYEAMGKWDFSKIDNNTLSLKDDYFGIDRTDLYYAVGHNYYQDQCFEDGREWLGSTDSETYRLDDEGTVIVSYKYDYHLTGKEALLWINLNGYQSDTGKNTRIGEVTKHTLRGGGLISDPSGGYGILKGTTTHISFNIHHEKVAEWYRNAHFGYSVKPNVCANYHVIDTSNWYDARTCNNGGVAYITFEVTAPEDKDCSFNIGTILVSDEF